MWHCLLDCKAWIKLGHATGQWSKTQQQIYNKMAEKEKDQGGAMVQLKSTPLLGWQAVAERRQTHIAKTLTHNALTYGPDSAKNDGPDVACQSWSMHGPAPQLGQMCHTILTGLLLPDLTHIQWTNHLPYHQSASLTPDSSTRHFHYHYKMIWTRIYLLYSDA